jgi:hypothetical protein
MPKSQARIWKKNVRKSNVTSRKQKPKTITLQNGPAPVFDLKCPQTINKMPDGTMTEEELLHVAVKSCNVLQTFTCMVNAVHT